MNHWLAAELWLARLNLNCRVEKAGREK